LLKEVLDLNPNDRNLSYVYRNLADIYKGENQIDSAIYYLDQSLQYADPGNNNLLANIYSLYYKIEAERGNYRAALEYQKHFVDNMTNVVGERQQQQLSSVEKKYQVELMQNQLRKKTIEQQQILLICGLLLLVILIISFLLYRKSDTNKKRSEEFYRKMDEMDSLSKNIEQNANEYQRAFSEQFSIMEKTVALEYLLNEEERLQGKKLIQKFNEIVYDQKEGVNWEKLYNTINGMSGGYLDALRERLPQLNEVEFRICCLTYAGLNNTQISIILRLAIDTIQAKKTGIRKKLGMEKNQNLRAYLQNV
jgi:ATP-dependent transcriptional regulator